MKSTPDESNPPFEAVQKVILYSGDFAGGGWGDYYISHFDSTQHDIIFFQRYSS